MWEISDPQLPGRLLSQAVEAGEEMRLVAIDGPVCSGKQSLAAALAAAVPGTQVVDVGADPDGAGIESLSADAASLVVAVGLGSLREDLRSRFDLRVFCVAKRSERRRRYFLDQPDAPSEAWEARLREEYEYIIRQRPDLAADIVFESVVSDHGRLAYNEVPGWRWPASTEDI